MIMKKFFLILAAVMIAFTACTKPEQSENKKDETEKPDDQKPDDQKPDDQKPGVEGLKLLSDAVVTLDDESSQIVIKFAAGKAWTAAVEYPYKDSEFILLASQSGEAAEEVELKVTADGLPEEVDGRLCDVVITSDQESFKVRLFQGVVFKIDTEDSDEFGVAGGKMEFIVVSNLEYSVTTYADVFPWAGAAFDSESCKGSFTVAANTGYDSRTAYMKFTIPDIQIDILDDEGVPTGETEDATVRVYVSQDGNVSFAWVCDFFWTMFSEGGRHSIAVVGDYFIINAPIDANNGTGGLLVFQKSDGAYVKSITAPASFTGITTDDAGNVILTAGGDYPIDESTWSLIVEDQVPLTVFVIKKADALAAIEAGTAPSVSPVITWYNTCYGYGVSNVRVTGDITGKAVLDVVSAAYQESEPTNRVVAWQFTGGVPAAEPVIRTVPASASVWTPNDLVAKHITSEVNGPVYYMGYDGNYQLWYTASMEAEWQDVLDSGSSWVEGYQCLDIIEWNGHKILGLVAETYFAWYGWGSLPSYLWIINIDDPTQPEVLAKTPIDISGNEGTWQYGATADLELVVDGNDLAVYSVDAGVSTYQKIVYPKL